MATYRTPECPALPLEIWAHIFTFVDEIDLWVACRQVSQALRAEAEREFAKSRLPQLVITARASYWFSPDEHHVSSHILIKNLLNISADGTRATYRVALEDHETDLPGPTERYICEWLRRQALVNSDLLFRHRLYCYSEHPMSDHRNILSVGQAVRIGKHISDAPLPAAKIDVKKKQVSFEWRPFLSHHFNWLTHAQRLRTTPKKATGKTAVKYLRFLSITKGEGLGLTVLEWDQLSRRFRRDHGFEEDLDHLQRAYIARLRRAHTAAGVTFALDDGEKRWLVEPLTRGIRKYLEAMQDQRY